MLKSRIVSTDVVSFPCSLPDFSSIQASHSSSSLSSSTCSASPSSHLPPPSLLLYPHVLPPTGAGASLVSLPERRQRGKYARKKASCFHNTESKTSPYNVAQVNGARFSGRCLQIADNFMLERKTELFALTLVFETFF